MKDFGRIFVSILMMFMFISDCYAREKTHVYSTWETLELDTCATAWLIKRFVDKDAKFKFFPKGELIDEGTPFDTPDSILKRTMTKSAFENALSYYKVNNEKLLKLGTIMQEVEINYWAKEISEEAQKIKKEVLDVLDLGLSGDKALNKTFLVLDDFYKSL